MQALRQIVLISALMLTGCVDRPHPEATGAVIYMEVCAACHGADLAGGVGPDLGPGSNASLQPDEFLVGAIRDGIGRMPSFSQTLTPEQIERVVAYLREVQGS